MRNTALGAWTGHPCERGVTENDDRKREEEGEQMTARRNRWGDGTAWVSVGPEVWKERGDII